MKTAHGTKPRTTRATAADIKNTESTVDIRFTSVPSPIGTVWMAVKEGALCALGFEDGWDRLVEGLHTRFGAFTPQLSAKIPPFTEALVAYFAGDLTALDTLPVDVRGGTQFQQKIWAELRNIPVGCTRSYAELGRQCGFLNSSRAVGMANGSNPVSLVIPCHRVIGSNGTMTGYGWGVPRKEWLLAHERVMLPGLMSTTDRR